MASVRLDHVSKTFPPDVRALRCVDLSIADGEFMVVVGPSGCGKSTMLRVIAGLESATDGRIYIDERVVNRTHPKDRDIAMVFQNYALYPHMTVSRNLAFALKLCRVPKAEIEERIRQAAKILGLEDLMHRKPAALSGGQRQRVAVGRAIVRRPGCFLFDEPLSNLDAQRRAHMRVELKALHLRIGTTTIHVTHDQEEAMSLGGRVAVMGDGLIHQTAAPLELYHQPVNRFVAGFVGTPRMNFIDGHVERVDGRVMFRDGCDLALDLPTAYQKASLNNLNRAAVLGIRPEALSIDATAGGASRIAATVRVIEPSGDRQHVFVRTVAGHELVACVEARRSYAPGQSIVLTAREDGLHVFKTGESGAHLLHGLVAPPEAED